MHLDNEHSENVFKFTIKAPLLKKNTSDQTLETHITLIKLLRLFFPRKTSSEKVLHTNSEINLLLNK